MRIRRVQSYSTYGGGILLHERVEEKESGNAVLLASSLVHSLANGIRGNGVESGATSSLGNAPGLTPKLSGLLEALPAQDAASRPHQFAS